MQYLGSGEIMVSKNISPKGKEFTRRLGLGLLCCVSVLAGSHATADESQDVAAPPLAGIDMEDPQGFAEGARALVCDDLGFLSFVWGIDEELRSRQFPSAVVQYAEGLIVVTEMLEIHGITTTQSAYLTREAAGIWTYSGFRGTVPVADRCTDITAQLAESFVDLALAASWGMPEVAKRVGLFEALEDDLRTRLELAELEREAVKAEEIALRDEMSGLETELVTARMAVCEIATHTQALLTLASFEEDAAPPTGFGDLLAETAALTECIEDAVLVTSTGSAP